MSESSTLPNRSAASRPICVAVVEDRATMRDGVALLIESAEGFRCTGSYASMEAALARLDPGATDVVLVDLALHGMPAATGIRLLRERCPETWPLAFAVYEDDEGIFDALRAGAFGCVLKKTAPRVLLETLRSVVAGGAAPMPSDAARRVLESFARDHPKGSYESVPRDEIRLLELTAEGHNHETAARELESTPAGIGRVARSVYQRLHGSFRTNLVR